MTCGFCLVDVLLVNLSFPWLMLAAPGLKRLSFQAWGRDVKVYVTKSQGIEAPFYSSAIAVSLTNS